MNYQLTVFLLLITWGRLFAQSYPVNPNQDILHYTFKIKVNDTSKVIAGEATVEFLLRGGKELTLDLVGRNNEGEGMVVERVTLHGEALPFKHTRNRLYLKLADTVSGPQEIVIYYRGVPANGLIIGNNKFGDRVFFGDNYPDRARHWLPCVDHPADKATVTWVVTAPGHYKVVASGRFVGREALSNGYVTTTWDEQVPISTKVMVFGAADFAVDPAGSLREIPVTTWVYAKNKAAGFHDFAIAPQVLAYYDSLIGPYPFEKLANVQAKTMYGGMENAGNIFYYEESVNGQAQQEFLIAHEIVHQWFGNAATEKDWPHAWLSEGFATYLTHVYAGSRYGEEARQERMQADRRQVIGYWHQKQLPIVNTGLVTYPKVADLWELLNDNTYQKAGWVLHMLRQELGDTTFWQALRTYYKVYRGNNANTTDFQKIVEVVAQRDMQPFFDQWLFGQGQPLLAGTWRYVKGEVRITINQQQEDLFTFPLALGLVYPEGVQVKHVNISAAKNEFTFTLAKPEKVLLDPQVNLLYEGESSLLEVKVDEAALPLCQLWELSRLNGREVNANKKPVLQLRVDESLEGFSGCNNFKGNFTAKGKKLVVAANLSVTRMACDDRAPEDGFLQTLAGGSFVYELTGGQLLLKQKGATVMVFNRIK